MADLTPYARLDVSSTRSAYGLVTYCGDTLSWHLADLLGREDTSFVGFAADPSGAYLIQQPINFPIAADPTQWALQTGTPGTPGNNLALWGQGTDETSGTTFLRQLNGSNALTYSATHKTIRQDDEGVQIRLFRAAPAKPTSGAAPTGANYAIYVEFSAGRAAGDYGLRLAIERGNPIRLEGSFDGSTWTTLDIASDQGDSEDYLSANGRNLTIDVVPLTARQYYDNLPEAASYSDPPPDIISVVLNNGDATLSFRTDQAYLAAGQVSIYGTGGQWTARISQRRYAPSGRFVMNEIVRYRPFQTQPRCYFTGYSPFDDVGVLTPTLTDVNKAYVSGAITAAPSDIDATGGALHTVILANVQIDFPRAYTGPQAVPTVTSYNPVAYTELHSFDQTTFCTRSSAMVTLEDNDGSLWSNIALGVRAGALYRGWTSGGGYDDGCYGITGFTALDAVTGLRSYYRGKQKFIDVSLSDMGRRGDSDLNVVGYLLPMDGQCVYYCARQLGYRMGIGDDRMPFPWCNRDSQCAHYHLSQGTNAAPLFRFQPQTSPMSALLQIRAVSGELSPDGKTILPFYLYFDPAGNMQFFPAPVGLINQWLNPDLTVGSNAIPIFKAFSMVPQFTNGYPNLNEMVGDSAGVTASLSNIRTPIVLEGMSPKSGSVILGSSYSPELGVNGSGTAAGYIGIDSPLINISRLYSSPEAVKIGLGISTVQCSFPATRVSFSAHGQSQLFPLQTISVQDFGLIGSNNPLCFYTTSVVHRANLGPTPYFISDIGARLLGQAA